MKAFRVFDKCREELRKLRIVFRPEGSYSDEKWLEIGAEGTPFRGRVSRKVCGTGWLRHHCPENAIDFEAIETLCHDDATVMTAEQVLLAIATHYWEFAMENQEMTAAENAFYLLFATVTRMQENQALDLKVYDIGETFAGYCLERTLEEVEDVLLSAQE